MTARSKTIQAEPPVSRMSKETRPRILLADDHPMVLEGIGRLIQDFGTVVGKVEDGRRLLEDARQLKPDMVILDISMPELNGLEAARQLKEWLPHCQIIFLTMHASSTYINAAFEAGAAGFLLKRSASTELKKAVQTVQAGGTYVTPLIQTDGTSDTNFSTNGAARSLHELTPRQREVLQLIGEGHSLKYIASLLNISPKTVEFHKSKLMDTLGLHTVADLTRYAVSHGLLEQ